ncbi:MAG: iron-sulfur cluster biosynthesis transcriptional regulator SufR [Gomphosphaeria aponina SAG 52.96 = DSM 107014]|uniref:Iron-sulfur cluster biosynthesis transcriptional regulator SufR n=1 Tax=Gomphosphaeria aponina SAG 52.96 = DSM 107014 TaxID=1521640 RepID=A0A941JLA7_9CHRO|nr:iron-sulfur cluster biosynthesis transcriptional regulator SufR [Gomphosphaeria aponina SAG 52.96 = DSM 107014]
MKIIQQHSTKQDILQYLLKEGEATATQIAEALEITPQATRRHLKDLEEEELVEHAAVQPKMGRPQYVYQLSRIGRGVFPHRYGEFAVSFLDILADTFGEKQVGEVLRKQWERKAKEYSKFLSDGSLQERMTKLVELRRQEGYMAELHKIDETKNGNKFFLAEHNCAIVDVAESYPSVCGHELEMFGAVLPDCIVERTHWINNGEHRCGYLIQLKQ